MNNDGDNDSNDNDNSTIPHEFELALSCLAYSPNSRRGGLFSTNKDTGIEQEDCSRKKKECIDPNWLSLVMFSSSNFVCIMI